MSAEAAVESGLIEFDPTCYRIILDILCSGTTYYVPPLYNLQKVLVDPEDPLFGVSTIDSATP